MTTTATAAGTLNMSLYELVTAGDTRVANQLSTDQGLVLASAGYILSGPSILSQAGTLSAVLVLVAGGGTYVAPVAAGYSSLAPGFGAAGATAAVDVLTANGRTGYQPDDTPEPV